MCTCARVAGIHVCLQLAVNRVTPRQLTFSYVQGSGFQYERER